MHKEEISEDTLSQFGILLSQKKENHSALFKELLPIKSDDYKAGIVEERSVEVYAKQAIQGKKYDPRIITMLGNQKGVLYAGSKDRCKLEVLIYIIGEYAEKMIYDGKGTINSSPGSMNVFAKTSMISSAPSPPIMTCESLTSEYSAAR